MFRKIALIAVLCAAGFVAFAQEAGSASLSPAARGLADMARGGVAESVMLAFVRTSRAPFSITAKDVVELSSEGVPQSVIAAALQRDAELGAVAGASGGVTAAGGGAASGAATGAAASGAASPFSAGSAVTENQLFRMRFGYIFYGGKVYSDSSLDPYLRGVLWSDPSSRAYLGSYDRQRRAGAILSWSGLGAILGGSVYGVVMGSQSSTNSNLNVGIAMGAVGAGVLSLMIGAITQSESWRNLYNGMAQYNEDLIAGAGR
ncbi:MAG: hypothetical protein M0Z80_15240 [Treponema sp.]|nr:hypothetical protein [Treponema sp.]